MKGFKRFQELLKLDFHPTMMGFKNIRAKKINRINARVKFAQSFQAVKAKGYSPETMLGYNGIFQTFLAYSAFEGFLQIFKTKFYEVDATFPNYKYAFISKKIRSLDKKEKFIDSVHSQLTSVQLKARLISFQNEETNNPLILAAAIRHTFAHGKLAANANDANPKHVAGICTLLSELIFEIIDTEFEKKINTFYEQEKKKGLTRRIDRKKK